MRRVIVDYAKLTNEILNLLVEKFPDGYDDSNIIRFKNHKDETIEAVEVRTEDTIYLVKISTKLSDRLINFEEDDDIVVPLDVIKGIDLGDDAGDEDDEDEVDITKDPEGLNDVDDDDDVKGKSSFTDYGFRFFLGNWTQELIYSNIQGYYIENTQDFFPGWEENKDPYLQFPDLKAIQWGGSTSYILNERFSFRNIVYQTEWQRKSAGSFIPKLAYNFNRFSNKINDLKSIENAFDIKIAPSYYYTLVMHRNWFVSAFLSPASRDAATAPTSTKPNWFNELIMPGLKILPCASITCVAL